jgi:predicted nuclease with TOPRIM domain
MTSKRVMIGPMSCPACHAALPEYDELRAEVERLRAEKEQLLSMLADSESAVRDRQGEIILLEAELRRLGYEL